MVPKPWPQTEEERETRKSARHPPLANRPRRGARKFIIELPLLKLLVEAYYTYCGKYQRPRVPSDWPYELGPLLDSERQNQVAEFAPVDLPVTARGNDDVSFPMPFVRAGSRVCGKRQIRLEQLFTCIGGKGTELVFEERAPKEDGAIYIERAAQADGHRTFPAHLSGLHVDSNQSAPRLLIARSSI